jgi:hypothetical protein
MGYVGKGVKLQAGGVDLAKPGIDQMDVTAKQYFDSYDKRGPIRRNL